MTITRQILIDYCENFLSDKIDKKSSRDFALEAITTDDFEFVVDDIVSDTIFEWDNEDINFEINKTNIQLWRYRLLTGQDDLVTYRRYSQCKMKHHEQ